MAYGAAANSIRWVRLRMSDPAPLLEARDITVYRGEDPLFENVNVSISRGQILQIQGNNGAGKTTLLKVLCGLILADEGDVFWRGELCRRDPVDFNHECLYLGHKPGLKQELTAAENLRSFASLRTNDSAANLDQRVLNALTRLQLGDRTDLPCSVLSAGQRRRVALSRLLVCQATLWVLDEPLMALDREGCELIQTMMQHHLDQEGAIIYTTHQPLPGFGPRNLTLSLDQNSTGAESAISNG